MPAEDAFKDLIERLRRGEPQAAEEFFRSYEPELHRVIHVRLTDPYLRRLVDSIDVCQSVLASFFVRLSMGELEFEHPNQLFKLLFTMARNKLLNLARDTQKERKALQTTAGGALDPLQEVSARTVSPVQAAAWRELLEKVRERLSTEERYLAEQRGLGRSWLELAEEQHEKPDALRKRLHRALERVTENLGLFQLDYD